MRPCSWGVFLILRANKITPGRLSRDAVRPVPGLPADRASVRLGFLPEDTDQKLSDIP